MTLSLHVGGITGWLLIATGVLVILGPVLAFITGPWLEIGALGVWYVCWLLAAITLILAVGSML